ncbi:MAG: hypothetical protein NC517_00390 [Firmicutes bacterium]|nr:hypothetical protein [Bacillota bacterium]
MDIRIFDNFDEDGQLTLFGLEEDLEELQMHAEEPEERSAEPAAEKPRQRTPLSDAGEDSRQSMDNKPSMQKESNSGELPSDQAGAGIRIRSCSSCGKLLFVREEDGGYVSVCNACGVQYIQR